MGLELLERRRFELEAGCRRGVLLPVLGRAGPVASQLEASLREGVWRLASGLLAAAGRAGPVGVWLQAAEKRLAVDRAGLGASQLEAE